MNSSMGKMSILAASILSVMVFGANVALAQSTTTGTTNTGTSTTSATVTKAPTANKFGLTLANETANSIDAARTKGGADTVNVISLSYKATDDLKLAATLTQKYTFVGRGEDQTTQKPEYFDVGLSASTTYGSFLGTEKTPVKYLFNLPTSEKSQMVKQAFSVGAEISLGYDLTDNISSAVQLVPMWGPRNGAADMFKNKLYTEMRYSHTSKLSSYGFLDHTLRMNTESANPKTAEVAALGLGLSYSPLRFLDLDVAIARERALYKSAANNKSLEFEVLDPKEINYTAAASLRF